MNLQFDKKTQQRIEQMMAEGQFSTPEEVIAHCVFVVKVPKKRQAKAPEKEKTLFEKLDELGVIGCVSGGPTDLATNPVHMEGFGR